MDLLVESYLKNLYLMEEISYISEDVSSFLNNFKSEKVFKLKDKIKDSFKNPNPDKITSLVKKAKVPKIEIDTISRVAGKFSNEFNSKFKLTKKVLDNSFPEDVNDNLKKSAATMLAIKGIQSKVDFKSIIKAFVDVIRYLVGAALKRFAEVPRSTMFEAMIGWVIIFMGLALLIAILTLPVYTGLVWWAGIAILVISYLIFGKIIKPLFKYFTNPEVVKKAIQGLGGGDTIYPKNQELFNDKYPKR